MTINLNDLTDIKSFLDRPYVEVCNYIVYDWELMTSDIWGKDYVEWRRLVQNSEGSYGLITVYPLKEALQGLWDIHIDYKFLRTEYRSMYDHTIEHTSLEEAKNQINTFLLKLQKLKAFL